MRSIIANSEKQMRSASEHPWTQQNRARITFALFPLSAPPGAALRVHALIANRAHTRAFLAILRDVRKLRDWTVDGAVRSEPLSGGRNSLITRENTGNFPVRTPPAAQSSPKSTDSADTYLAIPCSNLTGNLISSNREWLGVIREKFALSAIVHRYGTRAVVNTDLILLPLDYDFGTLRARALEVMGTSCRRWLRIPIFLWVS